MMNCDSIFSDKAWSSYQEYLFLRCKEKERPFCATFELTPFCNFMCNMCYIRLTPDEAKKQGRLLSADEWIKFGKEARQAGVLSLELTGGEVFTRDDFLHIYTELHKMGFLITIRSNGFLLDSKAIEVLCKYKPHSIKITIYGASNETYEAVTHCKNGFTVVTQNIETLIQCGIKVEASITLTRENQADGELVHRWGKEHGIDIFGYAGLINPIGNAKRDVKEHQMILSDEDCYISDDMQFREYTPKLTLSKKDGFSTCRGFGSMFCISWDGHMTLCNGLTAIQEDPFDGSLLEAFNRLNTRLKKIIRPSQCWNCRYFDYCISCPSKFFSETGKVDECSEEICRIARYRYKRALLIQNDNKEENT